MFGIFITYYRIDAVAFFMMHIFLGLQLGMSAILLPEDHKSTFPASFLSDLMVRSIMDVHWMVVIMGTMERGAPRK